MEFVEEINQLLESKAARVLREQQEHEAARAA